jgi:hypothetical protein
MDDDVEALQEKAKDAAGKLRGERRGGYRSVAEKVLVPVGAALTSAAVSYAVRKAPELFEKHVLPKLREQGDPRELAGDVMQRVRAVVEPHAPVGGSGGGSDSGGSRRPRLSAAERERERAERAARRRGRKTTASR